MDVVGLPPIRTGSLVWQPRAGTFTLTVVAKLTCVLVPGEAEIAEDQEEVNEQDQHWNDDETRSLYVASDLAPRKARADVTVVGNAFAPGGEPVRSLAARLTVGTVDKEIEICGERSFSREGALRDAARFARMPLRYERAAGGPGTANPVGVRTGRAAQPDATGAVLLPNLQPVGGAPATRNDAVEPVGFGPAPASFPARREKLGRHAGSVSRLAEAPLPEDFDFAYFNVAPPDQQLAALQEAERLVLHNLHREYPLLRTALPGARPRVFVEREGVPAREATLRCDALWIDTDRSLCTVVWRGEIPLAARDERGRVLVGLETRGTRLRYEDLVEQTGGPRASSSPSLSPPGPTLPAAGPMPSPSGPVLSPAAPMLSLSGPMMSPPGPVLSSPAAPMLSHSGPMVSPPGPVLSSPAAPMLSLSGPMVSPPGPVPSPPAIVVPPPVTSASPIVELSPDDLVPAAPDYVSTARLPAFQPPEPLPFAPMPPAVVPAGKDQRREVTTLVNPRGDGALGQGPAWLSAMPAPAVAAPREVPAAPRFGGAEVIELVWHDRSAIGRIRAAFLDPGAAPSGGGEGDGERIASDVARALAGAGRTGGAAIEEAMSTAAGSDGRYRAPLLALPGELRFAFDEIEALRLTVSAALPFVPGDARLREAVDLAKELLGTPWLAPLSSAAEGLSQRVRDAFAQGGRPPAYLGAIVDRALLERRAYQRRALLGDEHLRATLTLPGEAPRPTYLPIAAAAALPMFPAFEARLLVEVHPAQDHAEACPVALAAVAIGRIVPTARRGS
jgi:hypothetical protein